VLDEFDLFAKAAKQTVLYNLLDALQASHVQAGSHAFTWSRTMHTAEFTLLPALVTGCVHVCV
jgi:hypothetical protein